jgi:transposase
MKSVSRSAELIHLGFDVSKSAISVGLLEPGADVPAAMRVSSDEGSVRRLIEKFPERSALRVCYEAGPTGFTLARTLSSWGVRCQVIAPSRIPRQSGDRVKTDRRDAASLALLFRAGLLHPIRVPSEAEEAVRDLCRARQDLLSDLGRARRRLLSFLLRHDEVYRAGSTWTRDHERWLSTRRFDEPAEQQTFDHYLSVVRVREAELAAITADVLAWRDRPPLAEAAHRLAAYQGIAEITGLALAAEVGDWSRFSRATGFMAFTGLIPSEYSSGQGRRQGRITKAGNVYLRTQLVESAWHYRHRPNISAGLKKRQADVGPDTCARSWTAQQRLCSRYRRMSARGVDSRIIVTAVARELAGFLWGEMTA